MSEYEENLKRLAGELPAAAPMQSDEKVCPQCAETIKAAAIKCRYCGADVSGVPPQAVASGAPSPGMGWFGKLVLWVIAAFVALLLFGHFHAKDPAVQARMSARDAIEQCRKDEGDPLSSISTRRFVRGVCDKLTDEFRQKYGMSP